MRSESLWFLRADVDIGRLEPHAVGEIALVVAFGQVRQFDAGAVGSKPADDPAIPQSDERVEAAHRRLENFRTESGTSPRNRRPTAPRKEPAPSPPGHERSAPFGQRHKPLAAQAAEPGDAVDDASVEARVRASPSPSPCELYRESFLPGCQRRQLLPEDARILQPLDREFAQRKVALGEHEGAAALASGPRNTLRTHRTRRRVEMASFAVEIARWALVGKTDQVVGVRQFRRFVEIVDAPDERPSASRQVPKFSTWRSPTPSTLGAFVSGLQTDGQTCAQR